MPYEESLHQVNLFSLERRRLRADLTLAFKMFKCEVDLNPSDFSPPTKSRARRAHLPMTARAKPSSTQERCLFGSGREILEQIVGTSSLVTLSVYLLKIVRPSMVRNVSYNTCVTSIPIH